MQPSSCAKPASAPLLQRNQADVESYVAAMSNALLPAPKRSFPSSKSENGDEPLLMSRKYSSTTSGDIAFTASSTSSVSVDWIVTMSSLVFVDVISSSKNASGLGAEKSDDPDTDEHVAFSNALSRVFAALSRRLSRSGRFFGRPRLLGD